MDSAKEILEELSITHGQHGNWSVQHMLAVFICNHVRSMWQAVMNVIALRKISLPVLSSPK